MPARAQPGVGGRRVPAPAQGGHGPAALPYDDRVLVVRVSDLAAAGLLGGPVEHLGIEDRGVEGVARPQFEGGGRVVAPERPGRGAAFPEAESGPFPVGGHGSAPGAQPDRADGDGAAPFADPGRCGVDVLDGEVRGPGDGRGQTGGDLPDPGDRQAVDEGDGEALAEGAGAEGPPEDGPVEVLGAPKVPGHQADPARNSGHRGALLRHGHRDPSPRPRWWAAGRGRRSGRWVCWSPAVAGRCAPWHRRSSGAARLHTYAAGGAAATRAASRNGAQRTPRAVPGRARVGQ